ncbi:MAG TPA: acetamidase/formamidase family protein [Nitrososphaerales archaeon]|nr:acetamidase/formamidase family protein [Nitrososphaerales archaeon]
MSRFNVIKRDTYHYQWGKSHKPVLYVKPGDRVRFEVNEVMTGQFSQKSKAEDMSNMDFSKLYPLAGPVYVEGAEPGDALVVNIEMVKPAGWGWTGIMPGFGLLEEFTTPELFIWNLRGNRKYASFVKKIPVPLNPFCGVLGVAPPEDGFFDVAPPGRHGGNLDVRHLTKGSILMLPIWNKGALFSTADVHAGQGDGEVCISAIECPGDVTITFDLKKNAQLESPCYFSKPLFLPNAGYFGTTGISPDLMVATKQAVRNMISFLEKNLGLTRGQAYMLCSVIGELRIHEIVDKPNWVVGMMMPRSLIKEDRPSRKRRA